VLLSELDAAGHTALETLLLLTSDLVAADVELDQRPGAISSVNLLENSIGIDQAKVLASALQEHPALKSLCGNMGDETELDMSGKEMGVDGAIMLAPEGPHIGDNIGKGDNACEKNRRYVICNSPEWIYLPSP
jgi:hypothetical protein